MTEQSVENQAEPRSITKVELDRKTRCCWMGTLLRLDGDRLAGRRRVGHRIAGSRDHYPRRAGCQEVLRDSRRWILDCRGISLPGWWDLGTGGDPVLHGAVPADPGRRGSSGICFRKEGANHDDVHTTYDSVQHCTALKESQAKTVSMDCPYTGKGEEFSPTNLVEAALGGCMLLAMGAIAMRHDVDLSGARIDVSISATDKPVMRFSEVDVEVNAARESL